MWRTGKNNACRWLLDKEERWRTAVGQMESGKRQTGFLEMEGLKKYECCSRGQMVIMSNFNRMEAGFETVNTYLTGREQ